MCQAQILIVRRMYRPLWNVNYRFKIIPIWLKILQTLNFMNDGVLDIGSPKFGSGVSYFLMIGQILKSRAPKVFLDQFHKNCLKSRLRTEKKSFLFHIIQYDMFLQTLITQNKQLRLVQLSIYGPFIRKMYRVPSAPKRVRKPMKQRCIRLNFGLNLLLNYLPPSIFFLESPRLQSLWLMSSEGRKTWFFCRFSKKQMDKPT